MDPIALRVAARYKQKKKVESEDGGETTVYLYSERQIARRNAEKAKRLEKLTKSIGDLRSKVKRDLKSSDPERYLTALAVALIDHTYERVGNDGSAKDKEHFGVTGWQKRHVSFGKGHATIKYTGKSGVQQTKKVTDKGILAALRNAYEAADDDDTSLFNNELGKVNSTKVNAYLEPFGVTAKDIRGLHANREMQERLRAARGKGGSLSSDKKERTKQLKAEFKAALEETAKAVGHEAATLKSQYLVPGLEESFLKDGTVMSKMLKEAAWPFVPWADDLSEQNRLARRLAMRYRVAVDNLLNIEITKDNAVEILEGLIADVDNLEDAEKRLGMDLRNMVKLMDQFPHNDDLHHNGETVMEHVLQVIEAVGEVTKGKDSLQKQLLGIVALMHDLGKAYTYVNREGKHTFYDHMKRSVDVAEVLLAKHRERLGDLYHRIIDLVRHHDLFLTMVNSRAKAGEGLRYLKPILREAVYLDGHLDDLLTFSKADSFHSKSYAEKLKDAEGVIEDLGRYEQQQAEALLEKQRQQERFQQRLPEIRAVLEAEAPETVSALADQSTLNAALGRIKRYDLIKRIQSMVAV